MSWFFHRPKIAWTLIGFLALSVFWTIAKELDATEILDALNVLQKLAIILGGFIVAAFNLRFRLTDVLMKDWFNSSEFERLQKIVSGCSVRVGKRIGFFVILSVGLGLAPFVPEFADLGKQRWAAAFLSTGFVLAAYSFFEILNAFTTLESTCAQFRSREIRRIEARERKAKADDALKADQSEE